LHYLLKAIYWDLSENGDDEKEDFVERCENIHVTVIEHLTTIAVLNPVSKM
jgi:hypothetical protein